jgi:S-adenosylmethionine:tRNA ribosyltransferase-isomerase
VIANRAKRLRKGSFVLFDEGTRAEVEEVISDGQFLFRFNLEPRRFKQFLDKAGEVPLPPYIKRDIPEETDRERYQTVYAKDRGSTAAPTAGLHFDEKMLDTLRERGMEILEVTLHVGLDTWKPVTAENVEDHPIHSEFCTVTSATTERLNAARGEGRPIVAVGTTSVRTIESAAAEDGTIRPFDGRTRLFITPGYRFRVVDMLLTNFHLPRSTLLLLVASFLGEERWRRVYEEAVKRKYRFYSYGDAMLIF